MREDNFRISPYELRPTANLSMIFMNFHFCSVSLRHKEKRSSGRIISQNAENIRRSRNACVWARTNLLRNKEGFFSFSLSFYTFKKFSIMDIIYINEVLEIYAEFLKGFCCCCCMWWFCVLLFRRTIPLFVLSASVVRIEKKL